VKKISDDLDAGKNIQDEAEALGQFAAISAPFTRDGDKGNLFTQQVATAIFAGGPDSHGSVVDADGEFLVYQVTQLTPPSTDPGAQIKDFLASSSRDTLYAAFIEALRTDAGLSINQQVLSGLLNLDPTQQ
jgi:peptidyl-prolyl cis-trans isomerase D